MLTTGLSGRAVAQLLVALGVLLLAAGVAAVLIGAGMPVLVGVGAGLLAAGLGAGAFGLFFVDVPSRDDGMR